MTRLRNLPQDHRISRMDLEKDAFPLEPSQRFYDALDRWRTWLPGLPSRGEAVETLIERGLTPLAREWVGDIG